MKKRILFICNHNSARSQMAEALLRHLHGDRYMAFSGGIESTRVNPYTIRVLDEIGIETEGLFSKSVEGFLGEDFDQIVTVCDGAMENCPFFPGGKEYLHPSFGDPIVIEGDEEGTMESFRQVRDTIMEWIESTYG